MKNIIKQWFSKGDEDFKLALPQEESAIFKLTVDEFLVGTLSCKNGKWSFKYSDTFRNNGHEYKTIVGFPDVDRVYQNETLWPFFKVRIPGLKQPAVKEILQKEHIEETNEFALLKRFGFKTISNPYVLTT